MGSKLVTAAWSFVASHNERARDDEQRELETTEVLLLVLMAHTARDDDPEPWFQLERAKICNQLGIRDTEAGRKRVQRALGALAAAQAIALPEKYVRGYTPRYRLIYQGGCSASTPSPEVWTPGIPPTTALGDAQRPEYGRLASRSMDAQHPPEEQGGTKEEEDARATFELQPPPLPDAPPAPDPTICPIHPNGNATIPCVGCREARKARTALERRPKRPLFDCAAGRHKVITEDGICVLCGERTLEPIPIGATA